MDTRPLCSGAFSERCPFLPVRQEQQSSPPLPQAGWVEPDELEEGEREGEVRQEGEREEAH